MNDRWLASSIGGTAGLSGLPEWVRRSTVVGAALLATLLGWTAWHAAPEWGPVWPAAATGIGLAILVICVERQAEWSADAHVAAAGRPWPVEAARMAASVVWGAFVVGLVMAVDLSHPVEVALLASIVVAVVATCLWLLDGAWHWVLVPAVVGAVWAGSSAIWSDRSFGEDVLAACGLAVSGVLTVVVPRWWTTTWLWISLAGAAAAFGIPLAFRDGGTLRWTDAPTLVAVVVGATTVAALVAYHLLDWRWFWTLSLSFACIAALVGPAGAQGRRLAAVVLAVVVLVRVARSFSKATMRGMVLVAVLLALGALARIGQRGAASDAADLPSLIERGGDAVMQDALRPLLGRVVATQLGPWGWVAVVGALVVGYRHLEATNNRRYGVPVVTSGKEEIDKEFLERVRSMRLPTSSPVPGGTTSVELVEVLKEGGGHEATGRFMHAVRLVWALAFPAAGVTADLWVVGAKAPTADLSPDGSDDGDATRLAVTVETTWQGRFIGSYMTKPASRADAIEEAANFVAHNALGYTRLCPAWERWKTGSVTALGNYRRVEDRTGRHPELPVEQQVTLLEHALSASPCTGALRVALANRYDLSDRPLDAIRESLVATADFRRFLIARYRLATSLSMASDRGWAEAGLGARRRLVEAMRSTQVVARISRTSSWRRRLGMEYRDRDLFDVLGPPSSSALVDHCADGRAGDGRKARLALLVIADNQLRTLRRQLTHPRLVWCALRQDEREVWVRLLRETTLRRRFRDQVLTAGLIVQLRLLLMGPDEAAVADRIKQVLARAERLASRGRTGSFYNSACLYALVAKALSSNDALAVGVGLGESEAEERALALLGRAVRSNQGPLHSADWIDRDPDLAHLHNEDAFNELVAFLRGRPIATERAAEPASQDAGPATSGRPRLRRRLVVTTRSVTVSFGVQMRRLCSPLLDARAVAASKHGPARRR